MRMVLAVLCTVVGATLGCGQAVAASPQGTGASGTLHLCCNMHFEKSDTTDANYYIGGLLPAGTPVVIEKVRRHTVKFRADGREFELEQAYGTDQESMDAYVHKIFVSADPRTKIAKLPKSTRNAIHESRIKIGMTRDQVLLALGYPPTHRTASLDSHVWTYWYNRWMTYQVMFNDRGRVSDVIGSRRETVLAH